MTVQKGFFSQVPAQSVLPMDAAIQNQANQAIQNRSRQRRLISCLMVLAGILLLLIIVAVVGFMCWKSGRKQCNECESEISPLDKTISKSDVAGNSGWASFEDTLDQLTTATESSKHPKNVFTSVQPETSVRAPPSPILPTTPVDTQQIEIHQDEYRRPWYARLPLIGWMFHSEAVSEERSTRITISK